MKQNFLDILKPNKLLKITTRSALRYFYVDIENEDSKITKKSPMAFKISLPEKCEFSKTNSEKYGYQLSMLNTLLAREMITEIEYNKTKQYLKTKYKVA